MIAKPLRISRLDKGNPLAKGLTFCSPLNEMAGVPRDIAGGAALTFPAGITWGANGLNVAAATGHFSTPYAVKPSAVTILIRFTVTASIASAQGVFSIAAAYSNGSPWVYLQINGTALKWYATNAYLTGKNIIIGQECTAVITYDGTWRGYYDGVKDATSYTGVGANPAGSLIVGNGYQANPVASIACCAAWNRALSQSEIASISANPWQLLAQSSASRIMRMLTAVPGGFSGVSRGRTLAGISRGRLL